MDNKSKGEIGERVAREHLEGLGFKIVEAGFRCKLGEIDIIATKNKELYFIEVKTRWSDNCGDPLESITAHKQHQIIKTAKFYLASKRIVNTNCHFSAIGIDISEDSSKIEFIEDAFMER
jgi:putative endonuclease